MATKESSQIRYPTTLSILYEDEKFPVVSATLSSNFLDYLCKKDKTSFATQPSTIPYHTFKRDIKEYCIESIKKNSVQPTSEMRVHQFLSFTCLFPTEGDNACVNIERKGEKNTVFSWPCELQTTDDSSKDILVRYTNILESSNFQIIDRRGKTPLHIAAESAKKEAHLEIQALLEQGANPNKTDLDFNTPLHLALIKSADPKVIEVICNDVRIDLASANKNQNTPLHLLGSFKHLDQLDEKTVNKFIEQSCIDNKNSQGETPILSIYKAYLKLKEDRSLPYIAQRPIKALFEKLLGHEKINLNNQDNLGNTLLHLGIENLDDQLLEKLRTRNGIEFNLQNNKKQTACHLLANQCDKLDFLKMILKLFFEENPKINLELQDEDGNTPLHIFAKKCYFDTPEGYEDYAGKISLKDTSIANNENKTASEIFSARKQGKDNEQGGCVIM